MKTNKHFFIISRSFRLRMRNVSDESVEKIKTRILCSVTFFFRKSCRIWDNVENILERDRPQMKLWRMHITCWIPKATNTRTHTFMLCNTHSFSTATMVARTSLIVTLYIQYIACLVNP